MHRLTESRWLIHKKALQLRSFEHALKWKQSKMARQDKREAHALHWTDDEALDISSINSVLKRLSILSPFKYM